MTEQTTSSEQINTENTTLVTETPAEETINNSEDSTSLVGGSTDEVAKEGEEQKAVEGTPVTEVEIAEISLDEITLPEGVTLDKEFAEDFKGVAKELKLNQAQAQRLVDLQTKFTQNYSQKVDTNFKEQVATWKNESIAELGPNYKEKMPIVARAMNKYGSPEFRTLLNDTGLGNHKEVVKFFLGIGQRLTEDSMREPGQSEKTTRKPGSRIYNNSKMEEQFLGDTNEYESKHIGNIIRRCWQIRQRRWRCRRCRNYERVR